MWKSMIFRENVEIPLRRKAATSLLGAREASWMSVVDENDVPKTFRRFFFRIFFSIEKVFSKKMFFFENFENFEIFSIFKIFIF